MAHIPVLPSDALVDKYEYYGLLTVDDSGCAAPGDVERAPDACNSDGLLDILNDSGGGVGNRCVALLSESSAAGSGHGDNDAGTTPALDLVTATVRM